jgi:IS1 family transposase
VEGEVWVGVAFAKEYRLMLAFWIETTEASLAKPLIVKTEGRLEKNSWPIWVSDGFDAYGEALKDRHANLTTYPRTGKRGRPRKPRLDVSPQLRYAQVVKQRDDRHSITGVYKRSVYGEVNLETVSTVYIERHNLNLRHENRRLTRKTCAFSKQVEGLKAQMLVYQAYFNFVRFHRGLRHYLSSCEPGNRLGQFDTPAVAASLTDHPWLLKELMTKKIYVNH